MGGPDVPGPNFCTHFSAAELSRGCCETPRKFGVARLRYFSEARMMYLSTTPVVMGVVVMGPFAWELLEVNEPGL